MVQQAETEQAVQYFNRINWKRVLRDLSGLALAGGAMYIAYKQMDNDIKRIVTLPVEQSLHTIADQVPDMNQEMYMLFMARLGSLAQQYPHVETLYQFAQDVRTAQEEIEQILGYPVNDSVNIITGILPRKSDRERAAFISVLSKKAADDLKAQAIIGHLRQLEDGLI